MFYIIVKYIRKDNHIVDKSSTMIVISFQHPVYKTLYIKKGIRKSHKNHLRMFHLSLTDKNKSIAIIKIHRQLKEEIEYIDNYNISFPINRINNILLKK